MVKVSVCEECGEKGITGYVACVKKNLCAKCAAPLLNIPVARLKEFLALELKKNN